MKLVVVIGQKLGYPRYSVSWPTVGALVVSLTMRLRVQSPRVGHVHRTSVLLALSASPPNGHLLPIEKRCLETLMIVAYNKTCLLPHIIRIYVVYCT